jgi:chromosome segregation ATPase
MTNPIPEKALESLDTEQAANLLGKVSEAFDSVEALKAEKKEKIDEFNGQIQSLRGEIERHLTEDDGDAALRITTIDTLWRKMRAVENERSEVAADFNKRIKSAVKRLGGVMENLRQGEFDFGDDWES